MGDSIFGVGLSGLRAAHAGLLTAGHNIANASTPGYNRQETIQTTNHAFFSGSGFLGQGVTVSTVRRVYNEILSNQLALSQSQSSHLDAYDTRIQQLASMLGDSTVGIGPSMQNFFGGVSDVAAHPESLPARQALLSSANAMVARFNDINKQFTQIRDGVNSDISHSIDAINSYAQQIASLNQSIAVAESATAAQPANDLRDQRDEVIASLNKEIHATVIKESSGNYNIFVGTGQPLVVGNTASALVATPSLEDPVRLTVGYQNGPTVGLISESSIQGGTLGGLLGYRSGSLDSAQNSLGRVATAMAQLFNDQHALGQNLNGLLGGQFFNVGTPTVLSNSGNTGTATVGATFQNVNALTTSDYRLQYNGASGGNENFVLTRISDGVTTAVTFPTAGGYPHSLDVDGVTLNLSAGAAVNDNWLIEPTRQGASQISMVLTDAAGIAAASPIRTAASLSNSGNGTISAGSVSSIANLPLPGPVSLTYNSVTGQFTVSGAIPAAGPFAYPATTPGVAPAVTGVPPSFSGGIPAGAFSINGVSIGAVPAGGTAIAQGANVAAAINLLSSSTGVTATASPTTGALTLTTAPGGRQIAIAGTLTDTGLTAGITPGDTISFNGMTFKMSGTPANGDVFTIDRNNNGTTDNRNALALSGLQSANTMGQNASITGSKPTTSFQGAYSQMVSQIGNTARQMSVMSKAQQNMVTQTRNAQQSVSGVNLDEEAANLIRFQQAYQASGKLVQIASTLFQSVLDIGR